MKDLSTVIKKREGLLIALILALATFLRLFRLGYQSLWIDEINSVLISRMNIFNIFIYKDSAAPFIFLVNHFWQKLGTSDFMVRFPTMAFGVLSIYVIYKLAKLFLGIKEALLSAFLVSISLYHIIYSQEGPRPYTAFICFSLLTFYCLLQIFNADKKKYWVGFFIFSILNLYNHFFSLIVLFSETVIALILIVTSAIRKDGRFTAYIKKTKALILMAVIIILFSLPLLHKFIYASDTVLTPGRVVFNPVYYKNLLCRYGAGNGLALFVYNFFFLFGVFSLFKGDKRREVFLLFFWLIFPFLILSFVELKHFFHIRYIIFTYPAYIIIISKGITNILSLHFLAKFKNALLAIIILIFSGLSFIPLRLYYQMPARLTDWREAAEYIYKNAQGGAEVITNGVHDTLIKYYLEKGPLDKKIQVISHYNILENFKGLLINNNKGELYYVGYGEDIGYGTDEFSLLAERYFRNKRVFFSPVYSELVKRELIDGDGNSWVNVGVRGYRLVVYSNP